MMSCHLIPTWHEWNANAGDVMVTWFASYARMKSAYPQRMQALLLGAARVFTLTKGVRGRCPFPSAR